MTGNSEEWLVRYETDSGAISLSYDIVKKYLVSGDPSRVTDQEIAMFINLCRYQKLNPFLREAYLIKFGNEPATIVTGKDTFTKRAAKSQLCNGYEAGVIVQKQNGEMEYRKGTFVAPNETLVGGWAAVHRKDWSVPLETSVSLQEYQRKTREGKLMRNWEQMPATMIRKVALVQALREAFPEEFQGLYSPEEMPVDDSKLEGKPVNIVDVEIAEPANGERPAAPPTPPAITGTKEERLAFNDVARTAKARGWTDDDIRALLAQCGDYRKATEALIERADKPPKEA